MTGFVPELTCRNQHIFAEIVKNYLESGSPVGSGLIVGHPDIDLSSASVRAIMADLKQTELLFPPHPSAGHIPARAGLRLFVDA
jgi:heat-inducible transcriptional repressor